MVAVGDDGHSVAVALGGSPRCGSPASWRARRSGCARAGFDLSATAGTRYGQMKVRRQYRPRYLTEVTPYIRQLIANVRRFSCLATSGTKVPAVPCHPSG